MNADPTDPPLAGASDALLGLFRLPSLYGGNVPSFFTDPIAMLSEMLAPFCGGSGGSLPAPGGPRPATTGTARPRGPSPATRGRGEWLGDEPPSGSDAPEPPPRLRAELAAPAPATPGPATRLRPPALLADLLPGLAPGLRAAGLAAPAASPSADVRSQHPQPAGTELVESLLPAVAPAQRAVGGPPPAAQAAPEAAEIAGEVRAETSGPDASNVDRPGPLLTPPDPPIGRAGERGHQDPAAAGSPPATRPRAAERPSPTTQPGAAESPSPTAQPRAAESPSRPVRMVTAAGGIAGVLHAAVADEPARGTGGRSGASVADENDRAGVVDADDPAALPETTRPGTGSPPPAGSHVDVEALLDRFAERLEFEVRRAYGEEGPR